MNAAANRLFSAPELAEAAGVTPRTLRFYESKGLLSPRRIGARRVYDRRDRARLKLILRGKRLGFSLAEVAEYLELYDADPQQLEQLRRLQSLVDARIADLEQQREALETTLNELAEIRLQVMEALVQRSASPTPPPAARRGLRPRIRPKFPNPRPGAAPAAPGDD